MMRAFKKTLQAKTLPCLLALLLLIVPPALNGTPAAEANSINATCSMDAEGQVTLEIDSDYSNEAVTLVVTRNSTRYYIDQFRTDAAGKASINFHLDPGREYIATISISGQKKELNVAVTSPETDNTAPVISVSGLSDGMTVTKAELSFTVTATDDRDGTVTPVVKLGESVLTAGAGGSYTCTLAEGVNIITVEAVDEANNQARRSYTVTYQSESSSVPGSSGGGGGSNAPNAVTSTTGSAMVPPGAGGTVSLGGAAKIEIPANALQGTASLEVTVQKVSEPPAAPAGFRLAGDVYQFSVGGADSYSFNKPVTLTFSFDPDALAPGEKAEVYYYDASSGTWINLGGTVSGNTITVTVDHFSIFAVLAGAAEPEEPEGPAPEPAASLTDIAGHWAENTISRLVAQGVLSGYPDGTFRPDGTVTRAEFVIILTQAFDIAALGDKVFEDTGSHWARDSIAAAVAAGIVSGYEDNTFRPDQPVTREQMAVLAAKAAGLQETADISAFTDYQQISPWAGEAVAAVVQAGVMRGYPGGSFLPQSGATRAEAAIVIAGLLER